MSDFLRRHRLLASPGILLALALAGCGNDLTLPPATSPPTRQVIHLYALQDTPVGTPSGYSMLSLAEVQIFRTNDFDFVFDLGVDSVLGVGTRGDTVAVLIPRSGLGFADRAGLQFTLISFDSIVAAPTGGYEFIKPTRIRSGDTILAAGRVQTCNFNLALPRYAKLYINTIDLVTRSATITVIIDTNCGYRGLGAGIPTL